MNKQLRDRSLQKIARLKEIEGLLQDPAVVSDRNKFMQYGKEMRELHRIQEIYQAYEANETSLTEANQILDDDSSDPDLLAIAEEEISGLTQKKERFEKQLDDLLIEKDPNDIKNAVMEIRAGTGGAEASLFAAEIFRMYTRYIASESFKLDIISQQFTELGGLREVIFLVEGAGAYGKLRFESGVHRVQRVPATEASGRIHTSAVTVAVLPEAEEVEVEIKHDDLKIDVFRAGGPGGQSVNTTDSAVRVTHLPTGLVVTCQDEKSQLKNKNKAMKVLRSRLYDQMQSEHQSSMAQKRKAQVGSGDRSEKIRTYNFPERRVTDHRISLTLHRLEQVLDGELDAFVDALHAKERELQT